MATTAIPRQIVKLSLLSLRLPISIAERLGERSGVYLPAWPPVAAYDTVEGEAKKLIGRLIGDEVLVGEGERQQSAARHRSQAGSLSARADDIREEAEDRFKRRVEEAEEARDEAAERAERRRAEIQREEEEARQEVRARARQRETAVRKAARTRQKAVEAKERQAELARVQAETEALEREQRAVDAERLVSEIDEQIGSRKGARRNGSS